MGCDGDIGGTAIRVALRLRTRDALLRTHLWRPYWRARADDLKEPVIPATRRASRNAGWIRARAYYPPGDFLSRE